MANLTRLRMLEELDGAVVVDKPAGIAFSSVVKAVKRVFNLPKVGHGGSLDAMASGVFVLLLGSANRFAGDVMGGDRRYEGSIRLGLKTDTGDVHGDPLPCAGEEAAARLEQDAVARAAAAFKGDVFQTESRFCSIRKEGSAGYEKADTGEHKPFLVHVFRFDPGERDGLSLPFSLSATKGVLPRMLASDFGDELGCGACLESLRRVRCGRFDISSAVPFDKILDTPPEAFASLAIPMARAFA